MHSLLAESLAQGDGDYPRKVEPIDGGVAESEMEREMEWEDMLDFDGDEDSDPGLKIYAV